MRALCSMAKESRCLFPSQPARYLLLESRPYSATSVMNTNLVVIWLPSGRKKKQGELLGCHGGALSDIPKKRLQFRQMFVSAPEEFRYLLDLAISDTGASFPEYFQKPGCQSDMIALACVI